MRNSKIEELQAKKRAANAERQRTWKLNNPDKVNVKNAEYQRTKRINAYYKKEFIAYDGEGITTEDGEHHYVLFACSDGRYIEDYENGLSDQQCFDFLIEGKQLHPRGIHVIYGGSYDVNMMMKKAPHDIIEKLWSQPQVRYNGYKIAYRARKSLHLKKGDDSMVLYDVQTFFQKAFVKACDEYLGEWAEREQVIEGKSNRGTFTLDQQETTRLYCFAELAVLIRLMDELRRRLDKVDLRVNIWNGPGSVATSLFKREGIKQHLEHTDPARLDATRRGYFGGRFEVAKFGHYQGNVYEYDINSAYPAAMRYLPSLSNGTWVFNKTKSEIQSDFSLIHVQYSIPLRETRDEQYLGPAPFRSKAGTIDRKSTRLNSSH